jgi:RNA polymerase sigma-70 factor (ECF subfamily)
MSLPDTNAQARRAPAKDNRSSDAQLMAGILVKDIEAFEELYRVYCPRLTRFLSKLVGRPPIVEEVMNDTLMVVWNKADSFNGASKLSTWIFGIAYRKAMKALRKQDEPVEDPWAEQRISLDPTPEDALGRRRVQGLLQGAINELSDDHRAVIELTYFHEMGYREIAEIMGCPVDTIKTRMFHARRHLKRRLSGELPDWI